MTLKMATNSPGTKQVRSWKMNVAAAQSNERARQRASRTIKLSLQAAEKAVKDDESVTAWQRRWHKKLAATEVPYHPSIERAYRAAVRRASGTRAEGNWRKDFDSEEELRQIRRRGIVGITLGEASRYPQGSQERGWWESAIERSGKLTPFRKGWTDLKRIRSHPASAREGRKTTAFCGYVGDRKVTMGPDTFSEITLVSSELEDASWERVSDEPIEISGVGDGTATMGDRVMVPMRLRTGREEELVEARICDPSTPFHVLVRGGICAL